MSSICVTGRFPGTLRDDMTDGWPDTSPSLLFLLLLTPPAPPVTSRSASCGIREMIKEDSFKYLSRLSLMAPQSRWAPRWQEESVRLTGGDWGEGKYSSLTAAVSVYLRFLHVLAAGLNQSPYTVRRAWLCDGNQRKTADGSTTKSEKNSLTFDFCQRISFNSA